MTGATIDKHSGIVEPTTLPKPYTYTDTEEKAAMRCTSNCNINCYFHSRMGCTIDNTVNMRTTKPKYVPKYDQYGMVGRYMVKKGSR